MSIDAILLGLLGWALGTRAAAVAPSRPVVIRPTTPAPQTPMPPAPKRPVAAAPWNAAQQSAEHAAARQKFEAELAAAKKAAAGDAAAQADIARREAIRRKALADWQHDIERMPGATSKRWRPARSVRAGEVSRATSLLRKWSPGAIWPGLYAGRQFRAARHGHARAVEVWEQR